MSESVIIFSNEIISVDEFARTLQDTGGEIWEYRPDFHGYIYNQDKVVWFFGDNHIIMQMSEDAPEIIQSIRYALKGEPKTSIILEISRNEGSSHLAVDFAYKFSQCWNIVVYDNINSRTLSPEDLSVLYHSDKGFW